MVRYTYQPTLKEIKVCNVLLQCRGLHYGVNTFWGQISKLKFIYSEKLTKFCEISTLLLSYVVPVKSNMEISQNFLAFLEYMNFNTQKIARDFLKTFRGACKNPKWKKSRKFVDATLWGFFPIAVVLSLC